MTANVVRVHMMRLRKRILPLGLVVRTVHGRGYLLERDDASSPGQRRCHDADRLTNRA